MEFPLLEKNKADLYALYCEPVYRDITRSLMRMYITFDIWDAFNEGRITTDQRQRLLDSRDQMITIKAKKWLHDDKMGLIYDESRN